MKIELKKYKKPSLNTRKGGSNLSEDGEFYVSSARFKVPGQIVNKIGLEYIEDNILFVDFYPDQNWKYETDVTYEEVLAAFNAGRCIIGRMYDRDGNLKYTTRNVNIEHVIVESV